MSLRVETGIGEAGKLTIGGRLTLAPLATQLEIVATSIGLGAYPPYLEDVARIDMPTGTLSASLNVEFADAEGVSASPEIAVRGRLQIDDLLTIDRSLARKFLEWESLRIEGLDFGSDRVRIKEIALAGALAHVVVGADGRTNVESIFGSGEVPAEEAAPTDAGEGDEPASDSSVSSLQIEIGKISLAGLGVDFQDLSIEPARTNDRLACPVRPPWAGAREFAKSHTAALPSEVFFVSGIRNAGECRAMPLSKGEIWFDLSRWALCRSCFLLAPRPQKTKMAGRAT